MDLLLYLGGGAGALLALGALARAVWAINRKIVEIVDLVQELSPDHGRSIKDQVTGTAADVAEIKTTLTDLSERLDEHLAEQRPE
ncbi:hypothetical protein ACFY0N_00270 [Streptomyces vinaceus]|uniref:hypothetical protein n=1 Tax=Streptomyces vinaceus TaxID=1960 RepID=UPI00368A5E12